MSYEAKERTITPSDRYEWGTYKQTFYIVPSLEASGEFTSGLLAWACDPVTDRAMLRRILYAIRKLVPRGHDGCPLKRLDVTEKIEKGLVFRKESKSEVYAYDDQEYAYKMERFGPDWWYL